MAFLLRDIPDAATFERFAERYPRLDPLATEAFLRCMRTGSDLLEFLDRHLERSALRHGGWITLILLMREPDHTASPSDLALPPSLPPHRKRPAGQCPRARVDPHRRIR